MAHRAFIVLARAKMTDLAEEYNSTVLLFNPSLADAWWLNLRYVGPILHYGRICVYTYNIYYLCTSIML